VYAPTRRGAFVLKGLAPGRYMVRASTGGSNPGDPNPPVREQEMAFTPIDLSSADVAGVAVSLSKAAKATGNVIFDGTPAPRGDQLRMVVHTSPEDPAVRFDGPTPLAPVSDDLTFALGGLYPLRVLIGVQGLPDGWVLQSVRHESRDITRVPTDFASNPSRGPIEITLTNRVARPSVRVTDDQGLPLSSYRLVVMPANSASWQLGLNVMHGTPSADGLLKLGALLPGEYLLAALPIADLALLFRDRARVSDLGPVGTRVTLQTGDTRTIELRMTSLPEKR